MNDANCAGDCRPATCPAYEAMRDAFDGIRRREIDRHAGQFDDADRADLDALTRHVMQRVLAVPQARLPALPQHGNAGTEPCPGKLLKRLFAPPPDEAGRCEHDD